MAITAHKAEATIEFVGKDQITGLVQKLQGGIDGIARGADRAADQLERQRGILPGLVGDWQRLTAGVGQALSIAGRIGGAISQIQAAMKDAAQEQALETAFRRAFPAADELARRLEVATGGQIDDEAYQRLATQLHLAGVEAGQIETVLRLATQAANATGQEVTAVADAFADAVTRGNDKAFKAVGLNLDLTRLYAEQARTLGVSAATLDISEKRTILLAEAARQAGAAFADVDIHESAIARANQLQVRWNSFTDSVKSGVLAVGGFLGDLLDPFDRLERRQRAVADAARGMIAPIAEAVERIRQAGETAARAAEMQRILADTSGDEAVILVTLTKAVAAGDFALDLYRQQTEGAQLAEAARLRTLADEADAHGQVELALRLRLDADRALADAVARTTVGIREQYDAMLAQADAAYVDAVALSALADAAGQTARAIEILNAAEAARQGTTGTAVPPAERAARPARRGGGGRRQEPREGAADRELQVTARAFRELAEGLAESRAAEQAEVFLASSAALREEMDAQTEAWGRLQEMVRSSAEEAFGGATQALIGSGDMFLAGLGTLNDAIYSEAQRFQAIMAEVQTAGGGIGDAAMKAAPGAIAALGRVGAAFAQTKQVEFGFLAAGEAGAAFASFATGDIAGGGLHLASAVQYGVAAALAGGSASTGAGAGGAGAGAKAKPNVPAAFAPTASTVPTSNVINLHFSGAHLFADDPTVYRRLGTGIARELRFAGVQGFRP